MLLSALIAGLDITPASGGLSLDPDITHATDDSRHVRPGSLFVARAGTRHHGDAYIDAARAAGAAAILCEPASSPQGPTATPPPLTTPNASRALALLTARLAGDPTADMRVVGITGTNGKTTTAMLVQQLLAAAGLRCGLIGTVWVDDTVERAPAALTTPSAIDLAHITRRMRSRGCTALAMEASSHALHQHRTDGLRFSVAVFTNLTRDHLDYHGTMDHYAAAKARLFQSLPASGTAVVNAADPATPRIIRDCPARIWRAAVIHTPPAPPPPAHDLSVRIHTLARTGMSLAFDGLWGPWHVRVPLVGAFNAANILHAAAAAYALGAPVPTLQAALEQAAPPPGRLEPVHAPTPSPAPAHPAVYVDYAHTPDALERAIAACRDILAHESAPAAVPAGRLTVVFGCGGERDPGKRPIMGALVARAADRGIATSDNPRSEDPADILRQVLSGVPADHRSAVSAIPDRAQAIRAAVHDARAGDIVLIAGKGHEDYQILPDGRGGTLKRHFDDRLHARAALAAFPPPAHHRPAHAAPEHGAGAPPR